MMLNDGNRPWEVRRQGLKERILEKCFFYNTFEQNDVAYN